MQKKPDSRQETSPVPAEAPFSLRHRLLGPVVLFLLFFCSASGGYFAVARMDGSVAATGDLLRQCIYQTAILITGVGFGDVLGSERSWTGTIFTTFTAFLGFGFLAYFISTITAFIVGGELNRIMERKRMQKRVEQLTGHFLICGAGEHGRHVVAEMLQIKRPFVVIDLDAERLEKLRGLGPEVLFLQQDATDDDVLCGAGIDRASGLVAALPNDKDNLLLVITARQLNPGLRIVSRCIDDVNKRKLLKAGADSVVVPSMIGGLRMASELVRPTVVTFLDTMLRDRRAIRFEELRLPPEHPLVGKTLAEANLSRIAEVNVIATREHADTEFTYNPHGQLVLKPGMDVVVIGSPEAIQTLHRHFHTPAEHAT